MTRAAPDDFATLAPTMSIRRLSHHYRTSARKIRVWSDETGVATGVPLKPAETRSRAKPHDFETLAPTMTRRRLAKHYCTGVRVVARWIEESGAVAAFGIRHDARPVPDDFAERAATTCTAHLMAHYDCMGEAIKRWSRLTGVVPPKGRRVYPPRATRAKSPRIVRPAAHRSPAMPFSSLRREITTDGLAADHLRKFCAVYRCTENGRADHAGSHWRYGTAVLTPAELIERAERKGFDPNGWRHIPAIPRQQMPLQQHQQGVM